MSFSTTPAIASGRTSRAENQTTPHSSAREAAPAYRPLMTVAQGRHYICVGNTKFYQLLAAGKIRAVSLGRRTMVDVASLDAFIASLPAAQFKQSA